MIRMGKIELSDKTITIRFDGMPPETSTERASNKYPKNKDLEVPQQSQIFEDES